MTEFIYELAGSPVLLIPKAKEILASNGEDFFDCIMIDLVDVERPKDICLIKNQCHQALSSSGCCLFFYRDANQFLAHMSTAQRNWDIYKTKDLRYITTLYVSSRKRHKVEKCDNLSSEISRVIGLFSRGRDSANPNSIIDPDTGNLRLNINSLNVLDTGWMMSGSDSFPSQHPRKTLEGDLFNQLFYMLMPNSSSDKRNKWNHVCLANFEKPTLHQIDKDISACITYVETNPDSLIHAKIKGACEGVIATFPESSDGDTEEEVVETVDDDVEADKDGQISLV